MDQSRCTIVHALTANGDGQPARQNATENLQALELCGLTQLMQIESGSADVRVGLIDGPVELQHSAFAGSTLLPLGGNDRGGCKTRGSACAHGTFVAGMLAGIRGERTLGICTGCTLLVRTVFEEAQPGALDAPESTPEEVAAAIHASVEAGARVINLSLGLPSSAWSAQPALDEACRHAQQQGVLLVVAAGNQGRAGYAALASRPGVIPVVACDLSGAPLGISNLGPAIGMNGCRAPGAGVSSAGPGGAYLEMSGTSVAAAFVTGTLALLCAQFPDASAAELRTALLGAQHQRRKTIIPPLLNAQAAWMALSLQRSGPTDSNDVRRRNGNMAIEQAISSGKSASGSVTAARARPASPGNSSTANAFVPMGGGPGCACQTPAGNQPLSYVYAIGTISARPSSLSVEKQIAQMTALLSSEGKTQALTDPQVLYEVLKAHRYLASDMCWVFSVEGIDTYLLLPKDPLAFDQLVEAIKPATRGLDTDVVVGVRGPAAPPQMCNGLELPIVPFDRIWSFDRLEFTAAIPRPQGVDESSFGATADELFTRLGKLADNVGASDEHRALNYLSVTYPELYGLAAQMQGRDFYLTSVDVLPSRLSASARKVVDVVASFTNRRTDTVEKYHARVDVTEKYPFLVTKLEPYFDMVR